MTRHSTPSSKLLRLGAAILIAAIAEVAPSSASATPVTSAGNIPYSGISPGGVNMATGELILVMRPDLAIDGPMPVVFRRYYGSMLAREGLASGHLGPNWLGSFDWSLSVATPIVTIVTNRGQRIQFQQNELGAYVLVAPTDEKYRLAFVGGTWRLTDPLRRRVYLFDGTSHLLMQILDEHGNSLSLFYASGRLTQVSDGLGRSLQFSYDPTGLLSMVSDGTRSVHYFYTSGVLTSAMDAGGQTWAYGYVSPGPIQGLLIGVTEPLGNTPLTQAYDPLGRVISQIDALGNVAMYSYDAPSGNVYTNPLGNAWTYLHDSQNRLMTLTNPAAGATTFTYDPPGRLATMTRPLGDATSFAYDASSGYPSSITLGDGSVFSYGYSFHSVSGATFFDLATAGYPGATMETYGRDAAGNLTDFTDRSGFHWLGTYNPRGQLLTGTNPSGGVTTLGYAPNFTVVLLSDNAGNATSFSYDALSRLTRITWPDGPSRSFAYDNVDHVTGVTDERGKLWSYAYDLNERLMTMTDPLLEATGLVYDALDRVTQVLDPLSHATAYAYDPAGRLASMTDRTGNMTNYQYDALGRLTGVVDPGGGTSTYSYNANSRMIAAQDPLGHSASFMYDARDRVTHVTDPVGSGVDFSYDGMDRLLSASAPLGHTESFTYDARGFLTSYFNVTSEADFARTPLGEVSQLTDPNRNVWPAAYDPQGRPTSKADPLARTTSYTYDVRSRVTRAALPLGSVNFTYDPASRLTDCQWLDGTTLTYTYDNANRIIGATGASLAYDAAGRMTSSNGLTMAYDNEGRITSETYAPGKVVSYSYNSRGLVTQVMDWIGGATSFTYDAAQRLTGITRPDGTTATYGYDAADRLVTSVENRPPPQTSPLASIAITRDALGQPTSIDRRQPLMPGATSPATTSFTYDAASQINGFSWDPLGRLVSDGSRTFEWDGASRLTRYAAGADSPRFTYDAFGRMLSRTQGAASEQYVWNYKFPTLDAVYQGATPLRYYIHTPSGLLLYSVDATSGVRLFYHFDESGNTTFLTNTSSSVQTEYAYTPFGGVTALGLTANNPFTWGGASGAIQLGSSGLFQMGGGIYDAMTMRVISGNARNSGHAQTDPGGIDGSTSQWANPGPISSPGSWVTTNPGPLQSPGSWVTTNPGPVQSPGSWVTVNPGPINAMMASHVLEHEDHAMMAQFYAFVGSNPGPISSPGSWVTAQPGPGFLSTHVLEHEDHAMMAQFYAFVGSNPGPSQSFDNNVNKFSLEIDGVIVGGVHSVEGLESETDIVEYKDGEDRSIHTRPGNHKAGRISFESIPGPDLGVLLSVKPQFYQSGTFSIHDRQTGDWFVGRSIHDRQTGDWFVGFFGGPGATPIAGEWDGQ